MEDRFVITESLPPVIDKVTNKTRESESFKDLQRRQSIKIYGVFDGHGGEVRSYLTLALYILRTLIIHNNERISLFD